MKLRHTKIVPFLGRPVYSYVVVETSRERMWYVGYVNLGRLHVDPH